MDAINAAVARNLKTLREDRKLSLDELSRLSGVSKSMLAQIERGNGNPTLSSLWKIANGMKVPFAALIAQPKPVCQVLRLPELQPILEDGGRVKNFSLFPDDEGRHFSVYYMKLEPGSRWTSEPHLSGTVEFVTVVQGALEIVSDGKAFSVCAEESIRFPGDAPHSYRNLSDEMTSLHMILYNP